MDIFRETLRFTIGQLTRYALECSLGASSQFTTCHQSVIVMVLQIIRVFPNIET